MRGKLDAGEAHGVHERIIPAHAGQTSPVSAPPSSTSDHPRACGANSVFRLIQSPAVGSSPRMRGKRLAVFIVIVRVRIIPAHAGQTSPRRAARPWATDHPRACGANFATLVGSQLQNGSSPRMRGKQSDFMRKLLSAGPSIIGFAQWLQSSYYCSCLQSSAKTPISRGTTPTSLFLGFQNSITLLLLT